MSADLRRSRALAQSVLPEYGIQPASMRMLRHVYNTLFAVTGTDGSRYVLRIRRPLPESESQSRARVASEIWWLRRLRFDLHLPVPAVLSTIDGRWSVERAFPDQGERGTQFCALFRWIDGRFLDRSLRPRHLLQVGRLAACMHNDSEGLTVPEGFNRQRIDLIGNGDDEATIRLFAEQLSPGAADVVAAVLSHVREVQEALGTEGDVFGLIHADIHQRNYLFHRGELWLLDFDDCGWGHYLYDFAVTLQGIQGLPQEAGLREALLAGYREVRPLSEEREGLIDSFLMLRELQDITSFLQERSNPVFSQWVAQIPAGVERLSRLLASHT